MAGQAIADMRWAVKGTWADAKIWASIGPGSLRGMNRLHNRPTKQPLKQVQFLVELKKLLLVYNKQLPKSISSRIEAVDAQSTLCEFDKYSRVLLSEGRPKQLYDGGAS
jgi:hypothetical protein